MYILTYVNIPTTDPTGLSLQIACNSNTRASQITSMVDFPTVCCLCGDIGFSDKLFRCSRCQSRYQHSYCTSFYGEEALAGRCDWCRSEEIRSGTGGNGEQQRAAGRKEAGSRFEHRHKAEAAESGERGGKSMRPAGRRYKLLKDVMC